VPPGDGPMGSDNPRSDCKRWLHMALCLVWAALVGTSVPLEMVNVTYLNSEASKDQKVYHAFYVSNLAVAFGAVELLPLSVRASKPLAKPMRWWHLAGGVCSLPAFFTIAAASMFGTQAVLVVQLAGLLATFFMIDLVDGRVKLTEYSKILALIFIFIGVGLDSAGSQSSTSGGPVAVLLLPLVALSGIGYALQSKCNNALAEHWGSTARATVASGCIYLCCSLPFDLYINFGCNVPPQFDTGYWYLWLVAGFQSAFYLGSMAYLPRVLGYTKCYVVILVAKLSMGLFIDAKGYAGKVVPVTLSRVFALVIVLLGSITLNAGTKKDDAQVPACSNEEEVAGEAVCSLEDPLSISAG